MSVAMMKGGIASFKSFSLLKYITKKIRRGAKSAIIFIKENIFFFICVIND